MTYFPDTAGGIVVSLLADAGPLLPSDVEVINRGGSDYRTSLGAHLALAGKTPAGSRAASLPATLTAADHDKNIQLTGSGGSLTLDNTIADGFRCFVINTSTGTVTLPGMAGRPAGWASVAAGAHVTILASASAVYASISYGFPATIGAATFTATL